MQRFIEQFLLDFSTLDKILLIVILLLGLLDTIMIVVHHKPSELQESLQIATDSNTSNFNIDDNDNIQKKSNDDETLKDTSNN